MPHEHLAVSAGGRRRRCGYACRLFNLGAVGNYADTQPVIGAESRADGIEFCRRRSFCKMRTDAHRSGLEAYFYIRHICFFKAAAA